MGQKVGSGALEAGTLLLGLQPVALPSLAGFFLWRTLSLGGVGVRPPLSAFGKYPSERHRVEV